MKLVRSLYIALAILLITTPIFADTLPLQVSFTRSTTDAPAPDTITVSGATASQKVVIVALQQYTNGLTSIIVPTLAVTTADATGHASLSLASSIAWRSDWAVVDFTSGQFILAQPDGYSAPAAPLPTLRRSSSGDVTDIYTSAGSADVYYIDPGNSAWSAHVDDGQAGDVGITADGATGVRLSTMQPLILPPTQPSALASNGIIIVIDNDTMEMVGVRVVDLGVAQ